jgi:hypothetical protein
MVEIGHAQIIPSTVWTTRLTDSSYHLSLWPVASTMG